MRKDSALKNNHASRITLHVPQTMSNTSHHSGPPSGTVTFLFTDIVGSTEMWEKHGDAFLPVLQAHNAILMEAISRYGGYLIKTEGDAYKVAFSDPVAAA